MAKGEVGITFAGDATKAPSMPQDSPAHNANDAPKYASDLSRNPMLAMDSLAARMFDAALLRHSFASWHRSAMIEVLVELESRLEGQDRICDFLSSAACAGADPWETQATEAKAVSLQAESDRWKASAAESAAVVTALRAELGDLRKESKAVSLQAESERWQASAAESAAVVTALRAELGDLRKAVCESPPTPETKPGSSVESATMESLQREATLFNEGEHTGAECSVVFQVDCGQTKPGDVVVLVGNSDKIGNWDSQKGHRLITAGELYPKWVTDMSLRSEQSLEYKFVILSANSSVLWESLIANRQLPDLTGFRRMTLGTNFNMSGSAMIDSEPLESVEVKACTVPLADAPAERTPAVGQSHSSYEEYVEGTAEAAKAAAEAIAKVEAHAAKAAAEATAEFEQALADKAKMDADRSASAAHPSLLHPRAMIQLKYDSSWRMKQQE